MIDKKAMELIRKSSKKNLTEEEKVYCMESGFLIAHESVTHDEAVAEIQTLAGKISLEAATKSFLYSISSGDHRYRTILSSLIWAKKLPAHDYEKRNTYSRTTLDCKVCGMDIFRESGKAEFFTLDHARERLFPKINCMDICCAGYVLYDLLAFLHLPAVDFADEDIRILKRILGLAEEISSTNKVNALIKLISAEQSLSLTAADAYSIMGVLASCGAFDTAELKSYASGFVRCDERQFVYETDIYYPLHLWRGKYGINYSAVEAFFSAITGGKLKSENVCRGKVEREEKELSANSSKAESFFKDGEHIIDLDNRQRYYYGLAPLDPTWDRIVIYSATHSNMKRTELFFAGDKIKKGIYEHRYIDSCDYYFESDMDVATRNRKMILPKTDRGREQNLTPSLLMTPTYMLAQLHVLMKADHSGVSTFNSSNDQELPLPSTPIETREDFARYTEEYIESCPSDYQTQLDRFIHKNRVRVKFTAGDIFRVQLSMTHYTYGLILGMVRQLEKWPEVPKGHPIQLTMSQPLIIRQYDIITINPNMTAGELSTVPLLDMDLAQNSEILWETYPIVGHKELAEEDIDLGFGVISRLRIIVWGLSMHTFDEESWTAAGFEDTHTVGICGNGDGSLSMTYGVSLGIQIDKGEGENDFLLRRKENKWKQKEKVTRFLGLDPENACDDFARRYGGITRKQYIELAKKRYKK